MFIIFQIYYNVVGQLPLAGTTLIFRQTWVAVDVPLRRWSKDWSIWNFHQLSKDNILLFFIKDIINVDLFVTIIREQIYFFNHYGILNKMQNKKLQYNWDWPAN